MTQLFLPWPASSISASPVGPPSKQILLQYLASSCDFHCYPQGAGYPSSPELKQLPPPCSSCFFFAPLDSILNRAQECIKCESKHVTPLFKILLGLHLRPTVSPQGLQWFPGPLATIPLPSFPTPPTPVPSAPMPGLPYVVCKPLRPSPFCWEHQSRMSPSLPPPCPPEACLSLPPFSSYPPTLLPTPSTTVLTASLHVYGLPFIVFLPY